jgi:ABC-2 type transport system ATP-binding protein
MTEPTEGLRASGPGPQHPTSGPANPRPPGADAVHAPEQRPIEDRPAGAGPARTSNGAPPAPAPSDPPPVDVTDSNAEPILVLDRAGKDFGGGVGLQSISMAVTPGAIVGIVGPSGAGKTTAIRLITGALQPTSGTVRVLGTDPRRFTRAARERIGYMPQLFTLYPDLTADENVDFVASLFGLLWRERRRRVREVLQLVELWDARNRRAGKLSGGMQRRLELACALVHEPDLLLLDEPTAGIDPILRQAIWTELHRLKGLGRTLLVTTQYVTEAEGCDAVALIAEGRLIALGEPEALRRAAAGGDVIEVATEEPFDPEPLAKHPDIHRVEPRGLRTFRAAVGDAGAILPVIDDIVGQAGGRVIGGREIRLTFDEVFADLVAQAREQDAGGPTVVTGSGSGNGRAAA